MKKAILIIGLLFFYPLECKAEENANFYNGKIRITQEIDDLYQFSDMPVAMLARFKIADDIDFNSYEGSWNYRTNLREGLSKGPNLAGKYAVVMNGCGSPCQLNWIINVQTGKVLGNINTSRGLLYKKNSELLIADMPEDPMNISRDTLLIPSLPIRFFRVIDDKIVELGRINLFNTFESVPYDK